MNWNMKWEILQEEQKRMQAFQSITEENEQMAGVSLTRVAHHNLEEKMLTIFTTVRNNEAKSQQRLDILTGMLEVILNRTQQILLKQEERGARAASVLDATEDHDPHADASEIIHTIDEELSENACLSKRQTTSLTVQPEVPTNVDSQGFPSPEEQLNHHSEPDDPQENPAKRQGPGEYSVTEELQQTVEFNSITRQNEMDDCEGTRERASTQQDSPTASNIAEHSQAISCARRTPEETLQDNNDLTIAMNELGQARVQHDGLHEEKGGEVLTWNVDPDALWDRCAPND